LIFKDTFVLVFARVTILLLLLITSPVWVVAFFLKDVFKSSPISAAISKLPSQLFGTIFYNFALVLGIIITVLVTGTAQEGFKDYRLDTGNSAGTIAGNAQDAANFLNPNGASLIIAGVVPVFIGVSVLYFINQAFKNLFPLLNQVGTAIGNGATDFAKGIISGDVKGGFTKTFKAATQLATGGGQLENVATLAPKLAVKGGVMLAGAPSAAVGAIGSTVGGIGNITGILGKNRLSEGLKRAGGGISGVAQKASQGIANFEEQRLRGFMKDGGVGEGVGTLFGNNFGKDSVTQQIATKRAEYIAAEKGKSRENAINLGLTEAERNWNQSDGLFGSGGRDRITKNAQDAENLENAKGQTAADKGGIEARAKEGYYNTTAGQDALKARNLAENQLEQLKTIADNLKSGQESANKAAYYNDPTKQGLIATAVKSSLETELNKGVNDSNIDKVKAGIETVYAESTDGSDLIGKNAAAKASAENVRKVTTATRGRYEEAGKQGYYNSGPGLAETNAATVAGLTDELNKTITGNMKSGQESRAKAGFYKDSANDSLIRSTTESTIKTGVEKEIDQAEIDTKNAKMEALAYRTNRASLKSSFDQLANLKYESGGLSDAQKTLKYQRRVVNKGYQTKLDEENAAKRFKERTDKEREDNAAYTAAKAGTGTADQVEFYNDALANWKVKQNSINQKILDITTNAAYQLPPRNVGGFMVSPGLTPQAQAILDNLNDEQRDHNDQKPGGP
jgi:hypothetical protein